MRWNSHVWPYLVTTQTLIDLYLSGYQLVNCCRNPPLISPSTTFRTFYTYRIIGGLINLNGHNYRQETDQAVQVCSFVSGFITFIHPTTLDDINRIVIIPLRRHGENQRVLTIESDEDSRANSQCPRLVMVATKRYTLCSFVYLSHTCSNFHVILF